VKQIRRGGHRCTGAPCGKSSAQALIFIVAVAIAVVAPSLAILDHASSSATAPFGSRAGLAGLIFQALKN
jgi:hypothetical protein